MLTDAYVDFDPFWRSYFAKQITAGQAPEQILAGVSTLYLQRVEQPIDLALCARMPGLRDILAPAAAVTVTNKQVIAAVPALRELVLTEGAFTAADLPMLATSPSLTRLHINRMHISPSTLATLSRAPKLKQLALHRVTGLAATDFAAIPMITQLRLSECSLGDIENLSRMPRLRTLELQNVPTANLDFLAAPRLVSFTSDNRADDESGLAHLAGKGQLHTFSYPLSDLSVLASCSKVHTILVDGSGDVDFDVIAHLPITGVTVYFAPDEATAEAILARAQETWSTIRATGYREDWSGPTARRRSPVPPVESAAEPEPPVALAAEPPAGHAAEPAPANPRRRGFFDRLFGKTTPHG